MPIVRFVLCDVFTDQAFAGNQLAVFTDARSLQPHTMQALARELNFSECVFIVPPQAGGQARLRIFTPAREVPFAGHPTLGAAVVIGTTVQLDALTLETGAGPVRVLLHREGPQVRFGWMAQPLPRVQPFPDAQALLAALGVPRSELPIELYDNGFRHVFVRLPSREAVAALSPDFDALARLPADCFSTFAGEGLAWKTRMFAPGAGVREDPATGSAAGPLAVHLLRHGLLREGEELAIQQGQEIGRPSTLYARVHGTADALVGVEVGGAAVVIGRGEFRLL